MNEQIYPVRESSAADVTAAKAISHSALPWIKEACEWDEGQSTLVMSADRFQVAAIPSPLWDANAPIEFPSDRANMEFILKAVNTFYQAADALKVLRDLAALNQRGKAESSADLLWQYSEQIGGAIEEATQLLDAMGVSETEPEK